MPRKSKGFCLLSNHHRKSALFENSLRLLQSQSLFHNITIFDTSDSSVWGDYAGPGKFLSEGRHLSYDEGMSRMKEEFPSNGFDLVVVDNDLFFAGFSEISDLLSEFVDDGYDFACPFVSRADEGTRVWSPGKQIVHVPSVIFSEVAGSPPTPSPHFHSTPLLLSSSLWDSLSASDVNHHRKFIHAVFQRGAKIGGIKVRHKSSVGFDSVGGEWTHIGDLMRVYYLIEKDHLSKFRVGNTDDLARLGYFLAMARAGHHIPFLDRVRRACDLIGSVDGALQAWKEYVPVGFR